MTSNRSSPTKAARLYCRYSTGHGAALPNMLPTPHIPGKSSPLDANTPPQTALQGLPDIQTGASCQPNHPSKPGAQPPNPHSPTTHHHRA